MANKDTRTFMGTLSFDSGKGNTLRIKFPEVEAFPWSVTREGEVITFKLGEGKDEKSETHQTTDIRAFLIKNFNWNGIVNMMHLLEEKSDRLETYTRPTNLKGTAEDDDILIIPDEAIEAIIYEQAKYAIETKYADDPDGKIKEILKYVDGKPKKGFAEDVLTTTYEDLLKEDDNSSMEYDGKSFTMPNLKTVSEADLYDFLRSLALSRNGLWSDESKVTNSISIRRDLQTTDSKYNDTLFLAWKEGSSKKALQYIGSTEPGNLTDGQLEPQTTNMVLGFHDTSNATPSGRTRNAYRKKIGSNGLVFQSGDTTMNVHYGHHGIYKDGFPKDVEEYGLKKNDDGSNYNENELKAYIILVEILKILSNWGDGKSKKNTSAYKKLEAVVNNYEMSSLIGDSDENKKIEIKQFNKVIDPPLTLKKYQTYIETKYSSSSKKDDVLTILLYHHSTKSKNDYKDKNHKDLVDELKKEDVFESIVKLQLEEEFNIKNIDGCPGKGTIKKINRTDIQKAKDTENYNEIVDKAEKDWERLTCLFEDWDSNSILSEKTALKKMFQNEFRIKKIDYSDNDLVDVGDFGGKGINKYVRGWSEGCQIILGGQHFYEFMYLLTQFVIESKQNRWYYTIVDSKNIN